VGGGGFQGSSVGGPAEGFGVISFPQHSLQKSSFLADYTKEGFPSIRSLLVSKEGLAGGKATEGKPKI
jgi:hypothetical protein